MGGVQVGYQFGFIEKCSRTAQEAIDATRMGSPSHWRWVMSGKKKLKAKDGPQYLKGKGSGIWGPGLDRFVGLLNRPCS